MKMGITHKGIIVMVILMLGYLTGCGSGKSDDTLKLIKISGYVNTTNTDGTQAGKEGVTVTARRTDVVPSLEESLAKTTQTTDGVYQTTTDSTGYYELQLPPADYMILAEGLNNEKAIQKVAALESNVTIINLDFILTATGNIKGTVVEGGNPPVDHVMSNQHLVYIPGTSYIAVLDKDGSFTLSDVPVGSYALNIGNGITVEVTVNSGSSVDVGLLDLTVLAGTDSAKEMVKTAKEYMDNQKLQEALDTFKAAYAVDPTNKDAILGVAMLELVFLVEDDAVRDIISRWGGVAPLVKEIYGGLNTGSGGGADGAPATANTALGKVLPKMISPLASLEMESNNSKTLFKRVETSSDLLSGVNTLIKKLPRNKTSIKVQLSRILGKSVYDAHPDAPTVSEMQTMIETSILPVIEDAIKKLRLIEGTGFTFIVTPSMRGEYLGNYVILDDGDYYTLDAALSGMKSILLILASYNMDFDYAYDVDADPLSIVNGPYGGSPTTMSQAFLTLKFDGKAKMAKAGTALQDAIAKLLAAHDYLLAEDLDTRRDGGIQLPDSWTSNYFCNPWEWQSGYWYCSELLRGREGHHNSVYWLKKLSNALKGPVDIYSEGQDNIIGTPDDVSFGRLDLSKFFNNPLDRTDLPQLGYDLPLDIGFSQLYGEPIHTVLNSIPVTANIVLKSDLPDKTLNGIFPDGIPQFDGFVIPSETFLIGDQVGERNYNGMASDGTDLWLAGESVGIGNIATLYKINSLNGELLSTVNPATGWINDLAYAGGQLWTINWSTLRAVNPSTGAITTVLNLSSTNGCWSFRMTGNGATLWIGDGCGNVYEFDPALFGNGSTVYLSSPKFTVDDYIGSMTYGGSYLWINGDKVDPSTGAVLGNYELTTCKDEIAYLGSSLYSACDYRIYKYQAP